MKCEHENGWFNGNIVIDEKNTTNEEEAVFFCNTIGCDASKTFKFDVTNVEEAIERARERIGRGTKEAWIDG